MTNLQRLTINRVIKLIKESKQKYSESRISRNNSNTNGQNIECTRLAVDGDTFLEEAIEWLKNIDDTIYIEG